MNVVLNAAATSLAPVLLPALANLVARGPNKTVSVAGYSAPGDGGGGTFTWNPTDIRTPDGGTIVQVTGVVTGRWNRIFEGGAYSAKWYGATGNGSTDDTAAVQAFLNLCLLNQYTAYFPPGTYNISSTITLNFTSSAAFVMQGVMGLTNPSVTQFYWKGPANTPMFVQKGGDNFSVRDLAFYGALTASACWQMFPIVTQNAAGCRFERCQFTSPQSAPLWQPGHVYAIGNQVVGPFTGDPLSTDGASTVNGYFYQCTTGGTSASPGPSTTWTTTIGGTVNDNGVIWQCMGYAGTAFLVGDASNAGYQISECVFVECYFTCDGINKSSSGWRQMSGANIKNFYFQSCNFRDCGIGLDVLSGAGAYTMTFAKFSTNTCADIRFNAGKCLKVTGFISEASNRFLIGDVGSGNMQVTVEGGYWSGNPTAHSGQFPVVAGVFSLTSIGCYYSASNGISNIPVVFMINGLTTSTLAAAFTSMNNQYDLCTSLASLLYDLTGNQYIGGGGPYTGLTIRSASINDSGNTIPSGHIPFSSFLSSTG